MTKLTEGRYASEYLVSELPNGKSRTIGAMLSAGNNLDAGTVLGMLTKGAAVGAAFASNAANTGAITATPAVSAGAKPGTYKVVVIEPAANLGTFSVEDPEGVTIGTGVVATEFSGGGLTFTVADGATDFKAGEGFTITVAAGSSSYTVFDPDGTNGSEVASGILIHPVDATDGALPCVVHNWACDVNSDELVWPTGISAGEKAAAIVQLAALKIRLIEGV
jgi:hypothetical protein